MQEAKEWVLIAVCPNCNKRLSLTEKHIIVCKNQIYIRCYNCKSKFKIFTGEKNEQ